MSERAKKLHEAIARGLNTAWYEDQHPETGVARAICEHLGVDTLRETVSVLRWTAGTHPPNGIRYAQWMRRADAIATLLEAAGAPEPPEQP